MGNFFAELKRRHAYRVGAAYAVIAWLLLQLFNNVEPILEAPAWVGRVLLLLLVVGFPIALLLAWTFEATLAGIKRETPARAGEAMPLRHGWIDWLLAGALVVVIGLVSYEQLAGSRAPRSQVLQPSGSISIAVLPFTNLSGDSSQEFFSDGMTEEITAALAKVQGLKVIGRTSAFQFKGQNQDLRAIAQALSAGYLIEGSVRKAGDQVRITAQLIKADDGTHLWAENYDRQLSNIFATQEDIAQAIAGALRVPLGLSQGERLVSNRTNDVESYQQYLRARALYRARAIADAIAVLEPAVKRDPNYAPAQALLAQVYVRAPAYNGMQFAGGLAQSFLDKAETAAREAIRQDPKNSSGYSALALVEVYRGGRGTATDALFQQALALDANDADALHDYSGLLADAGRVKDALAVRDKLRTLEPFVPIYNVYTALIMEAGGDRISAIRMLEAIPPDAGAVFSISKALLAGGYAALGRYGDAADALLATRPDYPPFNRQSVEAAALLLRSATVKGSTANAPTALGGLANFYLYSSSPDRALEDGEYLARVKFTVPGSFILYWAPEFSSLRKTERFKALVRAWGFPDYWRARGWPDRCRPIGADDFECD